MTVTYVGMGYIYYDGGEPPEIQPPIPAHITGDIIFAGCINTVGVTITTSSTGWTKLAENLDNFGWTWFWKRATSSGTAAPVISSTFPNLYGWCFVYRGCASGTPYEDATLGDEFNTLDIDTETITTTDKNRLVVAVALIENNGSLTGAPPIGWTLDDYKRTSQGSDASIAIISKSIPTASTVSAVEIATIPAIQYHCVLTFALIPASTVKINIGDTWQDLVAMKINIGDSWKDVSSIKQNIGDNWKDVYEK